MTTKLAFNQINGARLNVKDFGAVGDGVVDDTSAITTALNSLSGGGVLVFPPGDYLVQNLTVSGDNITLLGYGARLLDSSPASNAEACTIFVTGDNCTIEGIHSYSTASFIAPVRPPLLDVSGDGLRLLNYKQSSLNKSEEVSWYLRNTVNTLVVNCEFNVGNVMFLTAQDVSISNCIFEGGGDDGIAIKAATAGHVTRNINISDCTFKEYSNMVAIGTEIQEGSMVEKVSLSNCNGTNVGSILWVKPGRTDVNYRLGIVRDISATNCHSYYDPETAIPGLSSLLFVDVDNGGQVYNINMSNCTLRGREVAAPATSNYGLLSITTAGNVSGGSTYETDTVDGITMTNCKWIDTYAGAANGGSTPGYPIAGVGNLTMSSNTAHTIKNIKLVDCYADGTKNYGFAVGTNGNTGTEFNKVQLIRPEFKNIATNTVSVAQAAGVRAKVNTLVVDADIDMSTGSTVAISSTNTGDTADTYRGEQVYVNAGSVSAGGSYDETIFVAKRKCFVPMVDLITANTVTQNATDKMSFTLTNETQASTLVSGRTTENLDLNAGIQTNVVDTIFNATGAWMDVGDTLRLQVSSVGAGQALDRMQIVVRYIEY